MNEFHSLTMQLSLKERSTLLAEAQRRNLSPDGLVLQFIKDGIAQARTTEYQSALNVLQQMDELVSRLPLIDAVELVQTSRRELEQRGFG